MTQPDLASLEAEITAAVADIQARKEALVALRRRVPPTEMAGDEAFPMAEGGSATLAQLFGDRRELILIWNMGIRCSSCTMWADGFNGLLPHLENRAAFVVASPDPVATQAKVKAERGWAFRMISLEGSRFAHQMGMADDKSVWPGVSAFTRDAEGRIWHHAKAEFGPGDDFCSGWHLFDLLPQPSEWDAQHRYAAPFKGPLDQL